MPLAHVQGKGTQPEEGGRVAGAAEERVDGEAGKREEGKAPDVVVPKTDKARAVFNIVDLRVPGMWPSAAADTCREMVIIKSQKCILTFLFL